MVFHSQSNIRSYAFRAAVLAACLLLLFLTADVFSSIATTSLPRQEVDYAFYTSEANEKRLALTFDDGPHPVYTEEVLRVLKKHDVRATFFVEGENALKFSSELALVADAGHEIGNHTFTQRHDVHGSPSRLHWELNSTNKVVESLIGRSASLYRPPNLLDIGPEPLPSEFAPEPPLVWAADAGYQVVGIDIDTKDYEKETPDEIVDAFMGELTDDRHIALFHDTNEFTPVALDRLIPLLKSEGYIFTTASDIIGLTAGERTPIGSVRSIRQAVHGWYISLLILLVWNASVVTKAILALIIIRLFTVVVLRAVYVPGLKRKWKASRYTGAVSVVIPAYNEAENIEATIRSVTANTLQPKEIIVVDDGSTDATAEVVSLVRDEYPHLVRLVRKSNGGKAHALNAGLRFVTAPVVVMLDADTVFARTAIAELIRHFDRPDVGVVAGCVRAIGASMLLSRFQSIEYTVSQVMEKEAMNSISAVGIVPGAIGAWRVAAIREAGGYSGETLVEDQDLTIAVMARGYRVVYEPNAIAYTETPHTVRDFLKQRFRWVLGTIQCFWKYSPYLFRDRRIELGWIVLPNAFLYNIFIPFAGIVIDIQLIISIILDNFASAIVIYMIFSMFDIAYAAYPILITGGSMRDILIVPLQRIVYRQLLFIAVAKSVWYAIEGRLGKWNQVRRCGQAKEYFVRALTGHVAANA